MATFTRMDEQTFRTVMFGAPHPGTVNFLRNQLNEINHQMSTGALGAAQSFFTGAETRFNEFASDVAILKAKNILQQHSSNLENFAYLREIHTIQQALPNMQNWIMTMPELREMYHNNQIDGYSETYVDDAPGCIGDTHMPYRNLMNGIVTSHQPEHQMTYYYQSHQSEEGDELGFFEKLSVLNTWGAIKRLMKENDVDLTDPYSGLR